MINPNSLGSNDHNLTADEWASLFKEDENGNGIAEVSRDDLPKAEVDPRRVPEYYSLSEENMQKFETDTNSKTGKKRTSSVFDLNPRKTTKDEDGESHYSESSEEYGERIKRQNDMSVWVEMISFEEFREKYSQKGMDYGSDEIRQSYTSLIKEMVKKHPREEGEELSSYRKRVKEIVDSMVGPEPEPFDKQAKIEDLKSRLNASKMSKAHIERLIDKQLTRYVDKKAEAIGHEAQQRRKALIEELLQVEDFEGKLSAQTEEKTEKAEEKDKAQPEEISTPTGTEEDVKTKEAEVKLDDDIQKWLSDEILNLNDMVSHFKKFEDKRRWDEAKVAETIEELKAIAREKQAARDSEKEAAAAAEKEKAPEQIIVFKDGEEQVFPAEMEYKKITPDEAEAAAAAEADEILRTERIAEEVKETRLRVLEKKRTRSERISRQLENILKNKELLRRRSGIIAMITNLFTKNRKKGIKTTENPTEPEHIEVSDSNDPKPIESEKAEVPNTDSPKPKESETAEAPEPVKSEKEQQEEFTDEEQTLINKWKGIYPAFLPSKEASRTNYQNEAFKRTFLEHVGKALNIPGYREEDKNNPEAKPSEEQAERLERMYQAVVKN